MPELVLNSLGAPLKHIIRDEEGNPILLSPWEQTRCDRMQKKWDEEYGFEVTNALGAEINITTMTTIARKVVQQTFFELPPGEFMPVIAGQGAFSSNLLTLREFSAADSFETGIIKTGGNSGRLSEIRAAVDGVSLPIYDWATRLSWTLLDIQKAARAGNWDYGEALQRARKKAYDLGIQRIAFLGAVGFQNSFNNCYGLLNMPNVFTDTTAFAAAGNVPISSMALSSLNTFVAAIVKIYRTNAQRTTWPTDFYVPESDWIAMGGDQYSPTFPIGTILEILEKAFKKIIPNGKFRGIKPISYAQVSYSGGVLSTDQYMLLNNNDEVLNMQLPVPYTTTVPNSTDNFELADVGYAEFTGVQAVNPRQILYLTGTGVKS